MKRTFTRPFLLLAVGVAFTGPAIAADQPNILVIMADDVGWMDVASYGGDIMGVKTTNIYHIGKEGVQSQILRIRPQQ